ncbi:MAG: histidine--tRNA ligase [Bacillota bacterium]|uniref:Histidine--tRNA ligase n=1 Tax=Thermanaerosceptrum fracticalcis TaxID=1712410 RepID=A0A7G6DZP5_THEFR|nr:histidine--tRNA ligase [Thermanaerosceptrum fracticalcis]QNB45299.1 histidine--tRNA ligase [Thermanaerosceptrum fracticalcis]
MLTTRPRGTNDILPSEAGKWHYLEELLRLVSKQYGYQEIRTPVFEHTELFQRGVGETTDIVEKEMYTFTDRGERSLTLRPEGTAPTVRAFLEHKMYANPQPTKLYYIGPMFRYDRPQAGRYRQFHQYGVEVFGSNDPSVDAEVIAMAMDIYERLGLTGLTVELNSVGCPVCRPRHREELQKFLEKNKAKLCPTCQGRYEKNPMRILDCKNPGCQELTQGAPTTSETLCKDCSTHLEKVQSYLQALGVPYVLNPRLVRGLDYYTGTAFEITAQGIGAQSSIGGGGRYNGLISQCGGPDTPGIGFALGMERILLTLEQQGLILPTKEMIHVFIAALGKEAQTKAFTLAQSLRQKGVIVERDYLGRSLKAQLKAADRLEAVLTVILGDEEIKKNTGIVRKMANSEQVEIPLDDITAYLIEELQKEGVR